MALAGGYPAVLTKLHTILRPIALNSALLLIARVDHAVDDDPILAQAVARGECGEGFATHDKITA